MFPLIYDKSKIDFVKTEEHGFFIVWLLPLHACGVRKNLLVIMLVKKLTPDWWILLASKLAKTDVVSKNVSKCRKSMKKGKQKLLLTFLLTTAIFKQN